MEEKLKQVQRKYFHKRYAEDETFREMFKERTRKNYHKRKAKKEQQELDKRGLIGDMEAPDLYADDCCLICSHFSRAGGEKKGWCLKKKKTTQKNYICGFFNPIPEDKGKFVDVPGVFRKPVI